MPAKPKEQRKARVEITVDLAPGERVQFTIAAEPDTGVLKVSREETPAAGMEAQAPQTATQKAISPPQAAARQPAKWITKLQHTLGWVRGKATQKLPFNAAFLFCVGLGVYLLTRFISLPSFPIYFSCDEAVNSVRAADLLANGLTSGGEFLPTFFRNGGQYCLGTSVYLQTLPRAIFGNSVWATRGSVALLTILAAIWLGLTLREHFKSPYWWSAPLLLAAVPTWFLHSRTAFEYALLVTFYSGFIYYYLRYRMEKPRALFPALVLGALAFYSYSPGQVVMVVTGLFLLFADLKVHRRQWRTVLAGAGLLVLLALPLVRFLVQHPGDYISRLAMYSSYLTEPGGGLQKAWRFLGIYLAGFNPLYWFLPNAQDQARHVMTGYAHLPTLLFPFLLVGLWLAIRHFNKPQARIAIFALLAAPAGAALVGLEVNRALTIIIPVLLLGAWGLTVSLDWLTRFRFFTPARLAYGLAILLAAFSLIMMGDALIYGPTWNQDYGRDGMQYGARQVFEAANTYQAEHPGMTVAISPSWTFQADTLREYFSPGNANIIIGTPDYYIQTYDTSAANGVFVVTDNEYQAVLDSGVFVDVPVEKVIYLPDGQPGFFFIRLVYRADAETYIQKRNAGLTAPIQNQVMLNGELVTIHHSELDIGPIENLFDGDPNSLARTSRANPMVLEITFANPKRLSGLSVRVGAEPVQITVILDAGNGSPVRTLVKEAGQVEDYKEVDVPFGAEEMVKTLRVELLDPLESVPANVHLWELTLR